jgi:hypothetical protein
MYTTTKHSLLVEREISLTFAQAGLEPWFSHLCLFSRWDYRYEPLHLTPTEFEEQGPRGNNFLDYSSFVCWKHFSKCGMSISLPHIEVEQLYLSLGAALFLDREVWEPNEWRPHLSSMLIQNNRNPAQELPGPLLPQWKYKGTTQELLTVVKPPPALPSACHWNRHKWHML